MGFETPTLRIPYMPPREVPCIWYIHIHGRDVLPYRITAKMPRRLVGSNTAKGRRRHGCRGGLLEDWAWPRQMLSLEGGGRMEAKSRCGCGCGCGTLRCGAVRCGVVGRRYKGPPPSTTTTRDPANATQDRTWLDAVCVWPKLRATGQGRAGK
jgi:hypothetical protein